MNQLNQVKKLAENFSKDHLSDFFRMTIGDFRPQNRDLDTYLKDDFPVVGITQLGSLKFSDERRMVFISGKMKKELTSRSGKRKQYDLAKQILKSELLDAGIFVFYDTRGNFRLSLVVAKYLGKKREFTNYKRYTYFVSPNIPNRTFVDQLGDADFSSIESILEAFSVEKVTKTFFKKYDEIFKEAEETITEDWIDEKKRLFTQRFFNRILFLIFLEKKGWLKFKGREDYLRAIYDDYRRNSKEENFHKERLNELFFNGLNNPNLKDAPEEDKKDILEKIGEVSYLNGGLFEVKEDDFDWFFPDTVISKLLSEIIYRFNFTVAESTPLDVEVAVDPEMLGKIFEELVTGRHETGSYYTPKRIVSFMCQESIKYYLLSKLGNEKPESINKFVYENNPEDLQNPEEILDALRLVKACDPACGSGAYLLGILHELLDLRSALFSSRRNDPTTFYERKLEIIQNNIYGVDIDSFAVNIAKLRLWLSLIVDYEGENPPPLPNLEFKIEVGDSLLAPVPSEGLQPDMFRYAKIQEFLQLKDRYLTTHSGLEEKILLSKEIDSIRNEISEWTHNQGVEGFDWIVEFAEVFAPYLADRTLGGKLTGVINAVPGHMELVEKERSRGFDIVLTNPPYVRQETIDNEFGIGTKDKLVKLYPKDYVKTADLYVAFFARAHQLIRQGGVSCFISSNKWLRADYGENLREHLLDKQAFHLVADFGELPVFQTASTFPAIFLWQKQQRDDQPTQWAAVKDLDECYSEGIRAHINEISELLPASQFGKDQPRLVKRTIADLIRKMEAAGPRLGEFAGNDIHRGILTGLNEAFIIDEITRKKILDLDPKSADIIKPILRGDNIRHYELQFRNQYLIWTYIDVPIKKYPGIINHLNKYKERAQKRWDQGNQWWELRNCDYYDKFEKPKIIWADICKKPRFFMDEKKHFLTNTAYLLRKPDWFLLGVFNSKSTWDYISSTSSILGDEHKGGRVRFIYQYMVNLPIPIASSKEKETIENHSKEAQCLHVKRRQVVEEFLKKIGTSKAETTSQNSLEKPWLLSKDDFQRRSKRFGKPNGDVFRETKEETTELTKKIRKIEAELDLIISNLYGL